MNSLCSFHLFIFVAIIFLVPTEAASCHPDDEAGLLAFKSGITEDPSGLLSTWKKGTYCCSWNGVYCRYGDRVITLTVNGEVDDAGIFLSGTISPSLAKLQYLEEIKLQNLKNITGPFPQFLFKLPLLEYAEIDNNRLSGPLPANIGELSLLKIFSIEGNKFTGPIPSSISNLTRLNILNLGGNLLTGTIPLEMANLKNLWILNLERNRLYGTIPKNFKFLKALQQLHLSGNRFSGELSLLISSLPTKLMELHAGQNNLSGSIPSSISRLVGLYTLDLSKNRLSGPVPKILAKMARLSVILNLSHNFLTDPFRVFHTKKSYYVLDLSYNQFHMKTIPKWTTMSNPVSIDTLKLAKCGIKMSLDNWMPRDVRSDNIVIDLSDNDISGSPEKLFNEIRDLKEFRASGNKLKFDMQKLNISEALETLDLSRNLVFGTVPTSVAGLKTLNLSQNHLCGKLPATRFPASVFANNDCLCGSPLPSCKG